jgi:hypothetical protein
MKGLFTLGAATLFIKSSQAQTESRNESEKPLSWNFQSYERVESFSNEKKANKDPVPAV